MSTVNSPRQQTAKKQKQRHSPLGRVDDASHPIVTIHHHSIIDLGKKIDHYYLMPARARADNQRRTVFLPLHFSGLFFRRFDHETYVIKIFSGKENKEVFSCDRSVDLSLLIKRRDGRRSDDEETTLSSEFRDSTTSTGLY